MSDPTAIPDLSLPSISGLASIDLHRSSSAEISRSSSDLDPAQAELYWLSRDRADDGTDFSEILPESDAWLSREQHIFIITGAGKPVYARYGNVQKLSPILCTCVGVLAHLTNLHEELNHFRAGDHTFLFVQKNAFYFIAASRSALPVSYLSKQLNFLYCLFLTIFSQTLIDELARHSCYDFRQIAEGTRPAWDGVVNNVSEDPAFVFAPAIPVSHMKPRHRDKFARCFDGMPVYKLAMLTYRNRVLVASNHGCDSLSLRLFVDYIWTPSFWSGEQWVPVFLQSAGQPMCQLYIHKHPRSDFAVAMVIPEMVVENMPIYRKATLNLFQAIDRDSIRSLRRPPEGAPPVFYCWAVNSIALGQIYVTDPAESAFGDPDIHVSTQKMHELCTQIAKAYDMVETNHVDGEYMFRGEKEVVAAYRGKEIEIYGVAKSADLRDEDISEKLTLLREFVRSHMAELFMVDTKFHIVPF
jgi:hypothetical protein